MAQAKWVHSPPIKYFMASFDLVSNSHKPTNAPHSSQAHIASTHTKTNRHIKLPRNFFVILTTRKKQSTNSHAFRPTLAQSFAVSDASNQEPYKNFISKLARPSVLYHLAIKPYNRNCKRNFDS